MRKLSIIGVGVILALFAFAFTACSEGPMGPMGGAGAAAESTQPYVPIDADDDRNAGLPVQP